MITRNNGSLPPQNVDGVDLNSVRNKWDELKHFLPLLQESRYLSEVEESNYQNQCKSCESMSSLQMRKKFFDTGEAMFRGEEIVVVCSNQSCRDKSQHYRIAYNDLMSVFYKFDLMGGR